jgi:hypothetical protein
MGLYGLLLKMVYIFPVSVIISPTGAIARDGDCVGRELWFFTGHGFAAWMLLFLAVICPSGFDL